MISVITTVRNGMPFIKNNLDSVAEQIIPDLIHVVVDDGSTDGTSKWLSDNRQNHVKLIFSKPVGRGKALNVGWRSVDSEFIAILDADDFASPLWIKEMLKVMRSYPQIDVLGCTGVMNKEQIENAPCNELTVEFQGVDRFLLMNPIHHSGVLIKRKALARVNGYDETRKSLFDYALWVSLLEASACIAIINRKYIYRRIHDRQHFENRNRLAYLKGCFGLRKQLSNNSLSRYKCLVPYLTFIYGLLPEGIRHWARQYWHAKNTNRED